jgi:translation initiation factor 2A
VVNYEISEIKSDLLTETAVIAARVVTDEKTKKKKSLLTVYKLSDISKPVKEMTISVCDRMKIKVSPDKKYVLLQSISDDTSTTSYYGESSLYFLDLLYGKFNKISLPEGPIHDFDWVPDGSTFITCAGYQPSKTHIYNNLGKFLKELCVSKVSTIKISHDSKLVCMAGFGNLNGDLEIYKLSDYAIIGKTKLYCGVSLNWSKDCKYLLGAVLSPRVRVDNEYRVFTYNGEDVTGEKFNGEIYECEWIDNNRNIYFTFRKQICRV